ncbi:hypothetical protein BH24PSE2_BH24PSE2_05170 [soil metagenome]
MQVVLAVVATTTGSAIWLLTAQVQWLVGALLMFTVIPFTLLVIMSTNRQLLTHDGEGDMESAAGLLSRWNRLHAVRSVLGTAAACWFLALAIAA